MWRYRLLFTLLLLLTLTACRQGNSATPTASPSMPTPSLSTSPTDRPAPAADLQGQRTKEQRATQLPADAYPPPGFVTSTPVAPQLPAPSYPPPAINEERAAQEVVDLSSLIPATFLPLINDVFGSGGGGLLEDGSFTSLAPWFCVDGCRLESHRDQGRDAVLVTQRNQPFDGVAQDVTDSINQNGWYQSNVWIRSPNNEPLFVWIVLEVDSTAGTAYFGTPVTPVLGEEWQPLTGDHHISWTGTLVSATWRIETEPANADLVVSAANLSEVTVLEAPTTIDRINVFPKQPRQTIESVASGNFDHRSAGVNVPVDPIGRFNIDNLGVNRARVMAELSQWQSTLGSPVNDSGKMSQTFQMMRQFQAEDIDYVVSIYDLPDWLLLSDTDQRRVVEPARYADAADLLIGWVQYGQQNYGIDFSLLGFNEPDLGARLLWSPQGMAEFISVAGPRLDAAGLPIRFIAGDCFAVANCRHFVKPIWQSATARPYVGLVASHSWDNPQPPDAVYTELGQFAASTGLDFAITEVGWDAQMWETGIPPMNSWEHAQQTALVYAKLLKLTGASSTYFWQMLGTDYPTNDGVSGYPVFHVIQQFGEAFPPGAQIVETSQNGVTIHAVAAVVDGKMVLALINSGGKDRTIQLSGLFNGEYGHTRSSAGELATVLGPIQVQGGEVAVDLARSSVNWFVQR